MSQKQQRIKERAAIVKLPKLTITKLEGTPLKLVLVLQSVWTKIDKADVNPANTFSYLKELLLSTVKLLMYGLPSISEECSRIKSKLTATFWKPSEFATAHNFRTCVSEFQPES